MKKLYKILNVNEESTTDEIKKSYHKLAFKYHPDKNKNNSESEKKFKEISEAYQILCDPQKKDNYDKYGDKYLSDNNMFVSPIELFQSLFEREFNNINTLNDSNIFFFSDLSSIPFSINENVNDIYEVSVTFKNLFYGTQKKIYFEQKLTDNKIKNTKYIINIKKGSKYGDNIIVKEGGNFDNQSNKYKDLIIKIVPDKSDICKNIERINDDIVIYQDISLSSSLVGLEMNINIFDDDLSIYTENIIKQGDVYYIDYLGMPIKDTDNRGRLYIVFNIIYPEYISYENKNKIKKILDHKTDTNYKSNESCEIYYKTNKISDISSKNTLEEDNSMGCIQQ